jgi:hypothetical protein
MITFRHSDDRGYTKRSWLDSRHTFSFGEYHDQRYMGFRDLRVINEDRVMAGNGFPTHSHRDMGSKTSESRRSELSGYLRNERHHARQLPGLHRRMDWEEASQDKD